MIKIVKGLMLLVISIILSLLIFYKITSDELLTKVFGFATLIVSSGSMETELSVGDVIIIKQCENYEVGDVVTYDVENEYLVTHRIIEKKEDGFVTKGDNNNFEDAEIIRKENIEGKVICKSRVLKWLYNYWFITILTILAILILW